MSAMPDTPAVPAQENPSPAAPPVLQVQLTLFADGGVQLAASRKPDPLVLLGLFQSILGQITAEVTEELGARRELMQGAHEQELAAGVPAPTGSPAIVVAKPGDEQGLAAAFARMKGGGYPLGEAR
jgi:hypothetical protein